jgi:tyrosine-protein kinase Etk/Wzc
MSLGLANKRVVLVDLDLRRPALANVFNMANADGISDYLREEKEIEAIIKRTDINPNVFLIPSGPIAINPSELLLSNKIQELFTYLEGVFDCIIIDTPPVSFVTDAIILSPLCDATLYVLREGVTPKMLVQKLDNNTSTKSLKNVAIVFNGVKGSGINKYSTGYIYGHGYIDDKKSKQKQKKLVRY